MPASNHQANGHVPAGDSPPIDIAHLNAQCMDDMALRAEIVMLFAGQTAYLFEAFQQAVGLDARKQAAHAIKGSARAIGAFRLGELAASVEKTGFGEEAEMAAEFMRVVAYIKNLA
jgi:HPt (histidine-containing phosphotransfer) domain-containing protein